MHRSDAIIVGGGQAGLAMSRSLTRLGIEHVILERGRLGERWRSERWDSLRLLTPNWMNALPGAPYRGAEPEGFMARDEVVRLLEGYGTAIAAPIHCGTEVRRVTWAQGDYLVETSRGDYRAPALVLATGQCATPLVPAMAGDLPANIHQVLPSVYRRPEALPAGGVLVVGASATGLQLAAEIQASGRQVTLSAGSHSRLPRHYRGHDIMLWLERLGSLDEDYRRVRDLAAARHQPSLQLVGRHDRQCFDLAALNAAGVRLAGRTLGYRNGHLAVDGSLAHSMAEADRRLQRLLRRIDRHIEAQGLSSALPTERIGAIGFDAPAREIDLEAEGIETLVWATGYRADFSFLELPLFDVGGELRHEGGVAPWPGLYVLGLRFLRRRKSSFLGGVGDDAEALAKHLARQLRRSTQRAA